MGNFIKKPGIPGLNKIAIPDFVNVSPKIRR